MSLTLGKTIGEWTWGIREYFLNPISQRKADAVRAGKTATLGLPCESELFPSTTRRTMRPAA